MNLSSQILSDVIHYMKYAKYLPEKNRRESFSETITRNRDMHITKFPELKNTITNIYDKFVYTKKFLPSMRSLQFGGEAIFKNNARLYNCCFQHMSHWRAFGETMFLLLSGVGKGYSVQYHHVHQLPCLNKPKDSKIFTVPDNIEGWGEAVNALVRAFLDEQPLPEFDFSKIREKGSLLVTSGGRAPGPAPLKKCLKKIRDLFEKILEERGEGTKLIPFEAHLINCFIADAVLAGGIRRAAMIALFSFEDKVMRKCKSGNWFKELPELSRANNSAVAHYDEVRYKDFCDFWDDVRNSKAGEPGVLWVWDKEIGVNPCVEASLRSKTFCNLVEINGALVRTQDDLDAVSHAAAYVNTIQASYTDFHFLDKEWKKFTEEDALIGVGITGIASPHIRGLNLRNSASMVDSTNKDLAKFIGINEAARKTLIKPAGTSSLVLMTSSGAGDYWDDYFVKRTWVNKNEAIYGYLKDKLPGLVEDCAEKPDESAVILFPQKAPEGASLVKDSTALSMLERVKWLNLEWIRPSHNRGSHYHNASTTIHIKEHEWDSVREWMWENRYTYHGISVLPHESSTYPQMPLTSCSKEEFGRLYSKLTELDLTQITESEDNTNHSDIVACAGGACQI